MSSPAFPNGAPGDVVHKELRKTVAVCRDTLLSIETDVDALATEKDLLLKEVVRIRDRCRAIDSEFLSKKKEYSAAVRLLRICEEEYALSTCNHREPAVVVTTTKGGMPGPDPGGNTSKK